MTIKLMTAATFAAIVGFQGPVFAESKSPAELRIRALSYQALGNALPDADKMTHKMAELFNEASSRPADMARLSELKTTGLTAVSGQGTLTADAVEKAEDVYDLLMNPGVLNALSRMPPAQAQEIITLIRARAERLTPVQPAEVYMDPMQARYDIPSMSDALSGGAAVMRMGLITQQDEHVDSALDSWILTRNGGVASIMMDGDPSSMIPVERGMVLGHLGKVLDIVDADGVFEVRMSGGGIIAEKSS